ncbi:type I secretion system permease/ATPase [Taklimakanibacter lacteus]|uniref:type I secretion system permease/ATPase n=1 Tax=Taklimakanibacter lacteus TaxID=2268456 RepID=UPI000E6693C5
MARTSSNQDHGRHRSSLAAVLSGFRSALIGIGAMSGVVNILALTGSFFMLQVYDRVVPGRSVPTLVGLILLAGLLFAFQGLLDFIRSRLLVRIGMAVDARISAPVHAMLMQLPLRQRSSGDGLQPLRDLDQLRSYLSGAGLTALFDLPWMPLYLVICFLFHVWIGVAALLGVLLLFGLTLLAELRTREPTKIANVHSAGRSALAEASRRNAEAARAMGFAGRIGERWAAINDDYLAAHAQASDVAGSLGTVSKTVRIALQSAMLAVGAYLVILGEASGGIMIASSIMMSRALAPIELAIAHWKSFISARQSWGRLAGLVAAAPQSEASVALPAPQATLSVEAVSVTPPGDRRLVVQEVSFSLAKGSGLGVIGASASGKSSLIRAITGLWVPARGAVRLDGAALEQWDGEALGRHVGYLPQDVQLFDGTIAENIARFETDAPAEKVLKAAQMAGVHDLVVHLPEGYGTRIGEAGSLLSAGQRQRIALARALYGDPFLVVLDEPNSNLDGEGEAALARAIASVRERQGIVIVVAHRPSALTSLDQLLVMAQGRAQAFGPKDEVLSRMARPRPAPMSLVVNPEQERAAS